MLMLCLIQGGNLIAQTLITGVVTDFKNAPLPYTSVYLSKTTIGVLTNDQGAYLLKIPQDGTFEMITSCVGFKLNSQIITTVGIPQAIDIQLSADTILLKELKTQAIDINRQKYFNLFVECFIGSSPNAKSCVILNPEDIYVYRDYKDSLLKAKSQKPLHIENKSLGYTVLFDLTEFSYNVSTSHLRYLGYHHFEPMVGNKGQNKRWERHRMDTYNGSKIHFLRTLISDSLQAGEGGRFKIKVLELDSNSITKSWNLWNMMQPLQVSDLKQEVFKNYSTLYYNKTVLISYYPTIYGDYEFTTFRSAITFSDSLKVYNNGFSENPYNVTWRGAMAGERIADLLPFDYVPKAKGKSR